MHSSTVAFLSCCLLFLGAQGMPNGRSRTCKCPNGYMGQVNPKYLKQHLKSEPVIHRPDAYCDQLEIIIILKKEEKCVDPQSPLGKRLLINKAKWENKRPAITTTTTSSSSSSSQPNTWSSAPATGFLQGFAPTSIPAPPRAFGCCCAGW